MKFIKINRISHLCDLCFTVIEGHLIGQTLSHPETQLRRSLAKAILALGSILHDERLGTRK